MKVQTINIFNELYIINVYTNIFFNSNEKQSDALADIVENTAMPYGCLWLEPRGRNIYYSIISKQT